MKVRKFLLENEKGQLFDMNNYKEGCFFTSPTELGYFNKSEFEQIGSTFIESIRKIDKKDPGGIVNFKSYDKCKEFIDFIEQSNKLKFVYIVPFKDNEKTFYRDVSIKEFDKTEKRARMLSCPIIFNGLSLWYEENTVIYEITPQENEIRWDFRWDSRFTDYNSRSLSYINKGHVEAPIIVEMQGHLINPRIELYVEGQLYQTVPFNVEIQENEKLLYCTKEDSFYLRRQKTDGTLENLFKDWVVEPANDNVIRLPKNKSCELRLTADNDVLNARITVLAYYKAV